MNATVLVARPVETPPPRQRYFWTVREIAIVKEHYPTGGVEACLERLPGRTLSGVYQQASKLGLRSTKMPAGPRQRWKSSPHIDDAIRRIYQSDQFGKGVVNSFAKTMGRPTWWVKKRAQALGLSVPRVKEAPWTDAEIELLEEHGHKTPDAIHRIFKRRGFHRSATAILVKSKRLEIDRADPDHFTATALSKVMGVDPKVVTRWIEKLGLRAKRRGTARTDAQGGDQWWISHKDFRAFVIANVAAIDLRKIVDKDFFIDLLANGPR